MGVNGLWTVVQPCARPTNLATLNRKRLAVDASIWIYQFLKAVRDKEGNALRNSHVVGFFRRICKLLWFGIQPVFVFDGGAPVLKRATLQARQRRREGRREDAAKTAGKLLAVQMHRIAQEEEEKRKRGDVVAVAPEYEEQEVLPDLSTVTYADEFGMSQPERAQARAFRKQDAYHLPELQGGIAGMGNPEDPRIMSVEELEEYARQFNNGEDINLYDFSKIDFNGDFFKSLPPPDRYNILNAARLRSRLRMGLSKEQLEEMFPDRMAFSRFQIERVRERNHLTQRLMLEVGMTGIDLTMGAGGARVAGEKDREYILVKNDGVEGGWALGVVSREKDVGEAHKPIDVDAIQIQYQSRDAKDEEEDEEDADFEDVPIEGVNRLPKPNSAQAARGASTQGQSFYEMRRGQGPTGNEEDGEGSLFVGGNSAETNPGFNYDVGESLQHDEEDDINMAIALSLQNQHGQGTDEDAGDGNEDEDKNLRAPEWTQKSVDVAKPIRGTGGGSMIAHIVNDRASAAVPKPRQEKMPLAADSDSEEDDLQAVLAKSRMRRAQQPKPVVENKKNPFDGPLPFPKLDWGSSLFAKKKPQQKEATKTAGGGSSPFPRKEMETAVDDKAEDDDTAGGFERQEEEGPRALPPWLIDTTDIRESLQRQRITERDINAEDKAEADEEQRLRTREMRDAMIEIDSSSDDSDVEILDNVPVPDTYPVAVSNGAAETSTDAENFPVKLSGDLRIVAGQEPQASTADHETLSTQGEEQETTEKTSEEIPATTFEDVHISETNNGGDEATTARSPSASPEPEFEDVPASVTVTDTVDFPAPTTHQEALGVAGNDEDDLFADVEYDEFSDPGDEELLTQLAEEAEEHARFASELNNKSAQQNKEDYERELRQLRTQQKKDRRDADEVTQVMVTECQALLRLFGIPYITAPMEAEAQCAELVNIGLVDGIVTDDSDIFLFGGTRVYKNMFNSNKFVECYIAADLEKELSLSREQLISLAQLLGSDYTDGLSGVGPVTAVEILSEFPGRTGLDQFREWWLSVQSQERPKEADASSVFRKKFRRSQGTKLFLPTGFPSPAVYEAYLEPEVDDSAETFQWGVPDVEGLRQFLMATIGWSKERTDEVLVPVIKDMNKRDVEGTQSNITRFFTGSVGAGAKDAFAPRQRAQGSKRMAAAVDKLRSSASGGRGGASSSSMPSDAGGKRKRTQRGGVNRVQDVAVTGEGESEVEADVDGDDPDNEDEDVRPRRGKVGGRGKRSKAS